MKDYKLKQRNLRASHTLGSWSLSFLKKKLWSAQQEGRSMSNAKVLCGHSLCDGTGRDTYVRALRTAPRRFPVLNVGQLTDGGFGDAD
jgi:hypothetical protein